MKFSLKHYTSLTLGLLISSTPLLASTGVGNGGDIIKCGDKAILLDAYEASKLKLKIDLSDPSVAKPTHRSMVMVAVRKLRKFDMATAAKLEKYALEMVEDLELYAKNPNARGKNFYLGNDIILEIDDSEHVSVPIGCEPDTYQLVSQKTPKHRLEYRYEANLQYWNKLSLQHQAMTILHEAWYRILIENGAKDSRSARYLNGLTSSKHFESYTFPQYLEDLKGSEMQSYWVYNNSTAIRNKFFQIKLKEYKLKFYNDKVCIPDFKFSPSIKKTQNIFNISQRYLNVTAPEFCFKNSRVESFSVTRDFVDQGITLRMPYYLGHLYNSTGDSPRFEFHANGKFKQLKDMNFEVLYKMFYECGRVTTFNPTSETCKGPYIHYPSEIKNPGPVIFDNKDERPVGLSYPDRP